MADNATLFKFVAKSIGMKRGVVPSFMAKPWANVSQLNICFVCCLKLTWFTSFRGAVGQLPFKEGKSVTEKRFTL